MALFLTKLEIFFGFASLVFLYHHQLFMVIFLMLNYNFYLIGNLFLFKEVSFQGIELRQYLYTDFFMDMLRCVRNAHYSRTIVH